MTTSDFPEPDPNPEPVVMATGSSWKDGEIKPGQASMDWMTPNDDEDHPTD